MRRSVSKYTRRKSASARRVRITVIICVILAVGILIGAAIVIGNILKKKLYDAEQIMHEYIEPKYTLIQNTSDTKNVNAYIYTFGKDATGYTQKGITDLSVCLRYSDGSLSYHSLIAEELGFDGMDSGVDLKENIDYLHKCEAYVSGTAYLSSFSGENEALAGIYREYEVQLLIEAASSGIDELLIMGIDVTPQNVDEVQKLISDVKTKSGSCRIGITLSYADLLEDKNGEYLASKLLMVADFIALDSKSVPCKENETIGDTHSFEFRIDSLHYYMQAYKLRVVFTEDMVELYDVAGNMGINNRQIIH